MPAISLPAPSAARHDAARTSLLRVWLHRIRTRRALAALHPDQARDAGLAAWDLRSEIAKPFWRA